MEYKTRKTLFKLSDLKPGEHYNLPGILDTVPNIGEQVQFRCIKEATPTYWGALSESGEFIPETTYIGMYPERTHEYDALIKKIATSAIDFPIEENTILIITNDWDRNYQHFLLETLPRIHAAVLSCIIDIPILLADFPHIREITGILYPDLKFHFVKPGHKIPGNISAITISFVQKNMSIINVAGRAALRELRDKVLALANLSPPAVNIDKKIFIGRKNSVENSGASRYMTNQLEFNELLLKFGYEEVTFEGLSLLEKSQKVSNARTIVTPVGANMMNLIFAINAESLYIIPHKLAFWRPEWFIEFVMMLCPTIKNVTICECVEIHSGEHPINRPYTVDLNNLSNQLGLS